MDSITHYFPDLTSKQINQYQQLKDLYLDWNSKINVISRKDFDSFYIHHVLHSLAIAKVIHFKPGTTILDVGSGGGFPGIPLAIMFADCDFVLIDSIGKKVNVIKEVSQSLGLTNVKAQQIRAENLTQQFDFVVSRAVTQMPKFVNWVKNSFYNIHNNNLNNGILYLKGGDLEEELKQFKRVQLFAIDDFFDEAFFATKKVVYLSMP